MRIKRLISMIIVCVLLAGSVVNAEVNYSEPDGDNQYYRTAPEIVMKHSGEGIMRYRFEDANGKVLSGRLDSSMSTVTIQKGILKDGENVLDIWLEDEESNIIEETMERRKYLVDHVPPEAPLKFSLKDVLEITATDKTSGVAGIYYAIEGEEFQFLKGDRVFYSLPETFKGRVCAYAVDYAGNEGEKNYFVVEPEKENVKEELEELPVKRDEEEPFIEILGLPEQRISAKPICVICAVTDDTKVTEMRGVITQKNQYGQEERFEITEWKKNEDGYQFQRELAEDGIYQISIEAKDGAGNVQMQCEQVIVDLSVPVISRLGEYDGKKMTEFVWNYKAEDIVSDLTSFTCEVRLDGILCKQNKIYKDPGVHLLEVIACDLAGNQVKKTAQFSILETPKIEMEPENVENDKVMEEQVNREEVVFEKDDQEAEPEEKRDMTPIFVGGSAGMLLILVLGIVIKKKGMLQNSNTPSSL